MEVDFTNPFPDQRWPKIRISLEEVNPIKEFIINGMANIIKTLGKVDAVKDLIMNGPFDLCAGRPPAQPTQGFELAQLGAALGAEAEPRRRDYILLNLSLQLLP